MGVHQYAIYIESDVRELLGAKEDVFLLGGIVDADYIEHGGMVTAIAAGLAVKYSEENAESINKFLAQIMDYNGVDLIDIGIEEVKDLKNDFSELVEKLK